MFSISKSQYTGSDKSLVEAVCLSTDTKETAGIANGSLCLEMDTGDIYCFNGANKKWIKLGGGDDGGSGVEVIFRNNTSTTLENTFGYADSIETAMSDGMTTVDPISAHGSVEVPLPMNGVIFFSADDISLIGYDESVMESKTVEHQGAQIPYIEVHGSGMIEYGQIS